MTKTALITGATSGIGKACAEKFASQQYNLVLTGRRKDRLENIQQELQNQFGIKVFTLCFDVQNRDEVFKNIESLPADWQTIDLLVNNAGLALGRDPFDKANMNDWETMLNTNVHGLLYSTRATLPFLKNSPQPHIINIGSIAGKEVYENGNVYCASKFAVDALSRSMRIDLLPYGIKVTAIHPGAVETEFSLVRFKGDESKAASTYTGFKPLTAQDIADTVYYCCSLPAHVCINELVLTCIQQGSATNFYKQ